MRATAFLGTLGAVLALAACGERPNRYGFEELGIPRTDRAVQAWAALEGQLLVTLFETKGQARLAVVDLASGRQEEKSLAGSTGADALLVDPSRRAAFVGTSLDPAVWRYDLNTGTVARLEVLDPFLKSERYVWALALGPGGRLYAGTYPSGLLLEYDPAAGTARSLGAPLAGRQYVRALTVGRSGTVYCGLGTPAAVAAVDPASGRTRSLLAPTPPEFTFAPSLRLQDGVLLARLTAGTQSREVRLPVDDRAFVEPAGGEVVVGKDGAYTATAGGRRVQGHLDLTSRQDGMAIMGLATGPDGAIYGPTYYNASLFRIDPETDALTSLGRVGGAHGEFRVLMAARPRHLLLPGYTGVIYRYDLDQPWALDGPKVNPARLGEIGHGQHLATAVDIDPASGAIVVATPPDYGRKGGALTFFSPEGSRWQTHAGLVPGQSLNAVCFGPDGRVFAGSSGDVGLGEAAQETAAHLITVDPVTGQVLDDRVPVREARAITALVRLDERRILGSTDSGHLFAFNVRTKSIRLVSGLPHVRDLVAWRQEEAILGIGWRRGLFRVDRKTLAVTWIAGSPDRLLPGIAFDAAGRAYVHDGVRVYRMSR